MPSTIYFLGSGGGRFATITQRRGTGGFRLHIGKTKMHVDPGPGALVRSHALSLNPTELRAVIVTHCHPDHYTDAEVLVEAMTRGGTEKKGALIGNKTVIDGSDFGGPAISKYHRSIPKEVTVASPGSVMMVEGIKIEATKAVHSDPYSIGLRFFTQDGIISYISDTQYFEEQAGMYRDSRVVIEEVTRPGNDRIPLHMCSDDAIKVLREIKPEVALLTHFGMKMISAGPEKEVRHIGEASGVRTVAARVGMIVDVASEIKIRNAKGQKSLDAF